MKIINVDQASKRNSPKFGIVHLGDEDIAKVQKDFGDPVADELRGIREWAKGLPNNAEVYVIPNKASTMDSSSLDVYVRNLGEKLPKNKFFRMFTDLIEPKKVLLISGNIGENVVNAIGEGREAYFKKGEELMKLVYSGFPL